MWKIFDNLICIKGTPVYFEHKNWSQVGSAKDESLVLLRQVSLYNLYLLIFDKFWIYMYMYPIYVSNNLLTGIQLVPIITDAVSLNLDQGNVYNIM